MRDPSGLRLTLKKSKHASRLAQSFTTAGRWTKAVCGELMHEMLDPTNNKRRAKNKEYKAPQNPTHTPRDHYQTSLRSLSSETTGELEVLRLDGDTLGVDGSQVGCELALQ